MIELQLFPPNKELLSHPLSHPHPQLAAAKSLMLKPPNFVYTSSYVMGESVATNKIKITG